MTAITKICKAESRKQHSHLNVFYFQIPAWWSSLVITTVRKQWRAIEEAGNRSGFWKKQVIFPDFPWGQMLWHWLSFSTSVYLNFSIFAMEIMILFFFFFFLNIWNWKPTIWRMSWDWSVWGLSPKVWSTSNPHPYFSTCSKLTETIHALRTKNMLTCSAGKCPECVVRLDSTWRNMSEGCLCQAEFTESNSLLLKLFFQLQELQHDASGSSCFNAAQA